MQPGEIYLAQNARFSGEFAAGFTGLRRICSEPVRGGADKGCYGKLDVCIKKGACFNDDGSKRI